MQWTPSFGPERAFAPPIASAFRNDRLQCQWNGRGLRLAQGRCFANTCRLTGQTCSPTPGHNLANSSGSCRVRNAEERRPVLTEAASWGTQTPLPSQQAPVPSRPERGWTAPCSSAQSCWGAPGQRRAGRGLDVSAGTGGARRKVIPGSLLRSVSERGLLPPGEMVTSHKK